MGTSKTENFSKKENKLARYAHALGHPARIAILEMLLRRNACVCGDIVGELPLSQSTVSQHLKELKAAGLIKGDIEGVRTCYCIDEKVWKEAGEMLREMFEKVNNANCC